MKPGEPDEPSNRGMQGPSDTTAARGSRGPADEPRLVERARAGDVEAFRVLVEQHGAPVHRLALRILRSPGDAEEVAQDAFVRAWRGLAGFRGEAAFSTWLFRIVTRLALDRAATLRLRAGRETALDAAVGVPADADPVTAGERQRWRELESLVATLPEMQRAAVTLFYHQDRSVKEVARILDLNENTVKTHLARARSALRSAWLRRHGGGSA